MQLTDIDFENKLYIPLIPIVEFFALKITQVYLLILNVLFYRVRVKF